MTLFAPHLHNTNWLISKPAKMTKTSQTFSSSSRYNLKLHLKTNIDSYKAHTLFI